MPVALIWRGMNQWSAGSCESCTTCLPPHVQAISGPTECDGSRTGALLPEDGAQSQMGELGGWAYPEADVLTLAGLRQDCLMVCLIVLAMRVRGRIGYYLFLMS